MPRRALTTISLLAALLSLAPARAAEPLPNVSIPVEAKKRLVFSNESLRDHVDCRCPSGAAC